MLGNFLSSSFCIFSFENSTFCDNKPNKNIGNFVFAHVFRKVLSDTSFSRYRISYHYKPSFYDQPQKLYGDLYGKNNHAK